MLSSLRYFSAFIARIILVLSFGCCWYGISHWLSYICWTILVTLEWIQLEHTVLSFLCVVGLSLLIFSWGFLHLYLTTLFACNLLFYSVFVWFWCQCCGGFIECLWEYSRFFSPLKKKKLRSIKKIYLTVVRITQ